MSPLEIWCSKSKICRHEKWSFRTPKSQKNVIFRKNRWIFFEKMKNLFSSWNSEVEKWSKMTLFLAGGGIRGSLKNEAEKPPNRLKWPKMPQNDPFWRNDPKWTILKHPKNTHFGRFWPLKMRVSEGVAGACFWEVHFEGFKSYHLSRENQ